ncbi:MAG: hypothetical protein IJL05_04800 [Alphaproteobacteria bacterium]|nr:hypothetical protein [Alphaproteobacteria bacterium]
MKKILLFIMLFLCACQTKHRGYVFPEDLDSKLSTVKTTAQLQDVIGDPQTKTIYGDEVWIYYGADETLRGPFPVVYDNKTVLLAWVKGNKVLKTQVLHDEDLKNVRIAKGETDIPAAIELNALEELFNNIGRFSPAGLGQ